jgi:hypothetical protein
VNVQASEERSRIELINNRVEQVSDNNAFTWLGPRGMADFTVVARGAVADKAQLSQHTERVPYNLERRQLVALPNG